MEKPTKKTMSNTKTISIKTDLQIYKNEISFKNYKKAANRADVQS